MKRRGPELEYWVEVEDARDGALVWDVHSIHVTRAEAFETAEECSERRDLRYRVLEVARYQLKVFGALVSPDA